MGLRSARDAGLSVPKETIDRAVQYVRLCQNKADGGFRYQLNSVPGVAEVATVGGAPREYQIDLDPNKLRAYGVTLGEVHAAVARSNSAVGGRVIHQGNAEYLVRSVGWIESVEDVRGIVVARRCGRSGLF